MKVVTSNRVRWAVPVLAAVVASMGMSTVIIAAPAADVKPKTAKAPKPKSRTVEGTFAQANATMVKLKAKDGEMNINLVPTTQYWRIQTGLAAGELKVGEMVKFTLKGTDDMATVQSLAPLTLKFDDVATLTLDKIGRTKFDRVSKLTVTDLVAGQEAKVASNLFADGKLEAREVWVIIEPVKATRKKIVADDAD